LNKPIKIFTNEKVDCFLWSGSLFFCFKNQKKGSGKGTQTHLLTQKNKNFVIVSAGGSFFFNLFFFQDTLREAIPKIPSLKKLLSEGKIVPEEITESLLHSKLSKLSQHILLDGYPRTLTQFEVLKKWDKDFDECIGIYLKIKTETVYERLKGEKT
jgi:adenylate kinase family enzyme